MAKKNINLLLSILFPRPIDFFSKSWLFLSGILASIIFNSSIYINPRIHELFTDIPVGSNHPVWIIIAFCFGWYIIQEFFVQQAKYLWNDLRDQKKDRIIGGKGDRLLVKYDISPKLITILIILRFSFGILLGFMFDFRLGVLTIIILLSQFFYETCVKSNAGKMPLLATILIATGSQIRFLSGALSISKNINFQTCILSIVFFYLGVGYISKYWNLEAKHVKDGNGDYPPRPQSEFFLRYGRDWQHFGFIGMLVTSTLLLLIGILPSSLRNSLKNWLIDYIVSKMQFPIWNIILIVVLTILIFLITKLVWRFLRSLLLIIKSKLIFKIIFLLILVVLLVLFMIFCQITRNVNFYVGYFFVIISSISFMVYEDLTYEQFLLKI